MTDQVTLTSVIGRSNEQIVSELDGELVMMSIKQGKYFGLDSIGKRIWEMIEQPVAVAKVIDQLLAEYDVSREKCEGEVLSLLNLLKQKEILILKN
ncbi:MAG: lasso peptide biosynthesis PqqD family chaperone [Pseudomonadales bacterium]|nr:lasso peptide biosynthesis PqqD family chaperone [Pseudomonadales bacterium]